MLNNINTKALGVAQNSLRFDMHWERHEHSLELSRTFTL